MINIDIKRVRKTNHYELFFKYDKELISRIKKFEYRKFNSVNNSWVVNSQDLFALILSYKGYSDIFFDFGGDENKTIFLEVIKKDKEKQELKKEKINFENQHQENAKKIKDLNKEIVLEDYTKYLNNGIIPYKYQCVGSDFLLYSKKGMLAMEQGTGKSLTSILTCERNPDIKKVFVIVPNSLKYNYKNEITKFTGQKAYIIGDKKNDKFEDCKYIIVNYNYFRDNPFTFKKSVYIKKIKDIFDILPDTFIFDESQNIKNESANQTKNILYTLKMINPNFIFLLTGTPMPSRITELYTQLKLLSPEQVTSKSVFYQDFCNMVYSPQNMGYINIEEPDLNKLFNKMDGVMFRVKKKDVLKDLPDLVVNELYVDLSDAELKVYNDIEKGIKTLDLKKLQVNDSTEKLHFLTILQKLRQYTASLKVRALDELIKRHNEEDQKVIIFDEFKSTLNELHKLNSSNSRLFTGDINVVDRQQYVDEFQNNDDIQNLFLTVQTGNAGLTLTRSSLIYMITQNYVPSLNEQCYARAHRIGQENNVSVFNLIARNTVDEQVNEILKFKKLVINKVIDNQDFVEENNKINVIDQLIKFYKKHEFRGK